LTMPPSPPILAETVSIPTLPNWLTWLTLIAGVFLAAGVVWKGLVFVFRILTKIDDTLPVIVAIADQFSSDSGSTLKDAVNRIEATANQAQAVAKTAEEAAVRTAEMAEQTAKTVGDRSDALALELSARASEFAEEQKKLMEEVREHLAAIRRNEGSILDAMMGSERRGFPASGMVEKAPPEAGTEAVVVDVASVAPEAAEAIAKAAREGGGT
jgi:gas vesicle protein